MRKIISIKIDNYRAFFGHYDVIQLPEGQNLFIYGENGSGKSSLFKALSDYLTRSRNATTRFVPNIHSSLEPGNISIEFANFTDSPIAEVNGSRQTFQFSTGSTNNEVQFIQDSALVSGFLEYRSLLDVYLHKEKRPNLFSLIVLKLLGNHIPISSGGAYRFGARWIQLQENLIKNSTSRRNHNHRRSLTELPIFQQHLTTTLTEVFTELNRMLEHYFHDLHLRLAFELKDFNFNYSKNRENWFTTADLRLDVYKDGAILTEDYGDILNEARLSAFSICLYLASLKLNPNVDLKILYLDDIFVGLDASNRLPILNILNNEFSDYQIIISTYDRFWYELAKRQFDAHNNGRWVSAEFYVGSQTANATNFDKPIITNSMSEFDRAVRFLHDQINPDYPAAANYFRKSIEELIHDYIPPYELADSNSIKYPDHKLSIRISKTHQFLKKTNNDTTEVDAIISLLHGLIHPLSHFSIKSPIYRRELIQIENAIRGLKVRLKQMEITQNYKSILDPGKRIRLTFCVDAAANHYFYYEIILKTPLVLKRGVAVPHQICLADCHVDRYYGNNGTINYRGGSVSRNNAQFNYPSIETAFTRIHTYLTTNQLNFAFPATGYQSCCDWDNNNTWQPLSNLMTW